MLSLLSNIESSTLIGENDPFRIAFNIAGLNIYWYAIFSIIGYFVAICIFLLVITKRYKMNYDIAFYYIFIALPSILFGARIWSVMIGDASIDKFFNLREGGLAIQGGVVFGVIAALIYFPLMLRKPKYHLRVIVDDNVYIKRPSIWLYADAIIPTILIGQAIGRWGNFFNGEIFGQPITAESLSWLKDLMPGVYEHMTPQIGLSIDDFTNGTMYFQPLFLYESFINIMTFIFIYVILAEMKFMKAGTIACLYFVDYGIIRFIMESMRNGKFEFLGTYVLNGIMLAVGAFLFVYCQWIQPRYRKYKIWPYVLEWCKWFLNKKETNKPLITSKYYIRTEGEILYFSNH